MNDLKHCTRFGLSRVIQEERGQMLPMACLMMAILIGMAGFTIDSARVYYSYRQLQASTDAAALAGAEALPTSSAATQAIAYSGVSGGANAIPGLPGVAMVSGYPKVECLASLTNSGLPCVSPAGGNAIQVKQQVTVPVYLTQLFGAKPVTMVTTATASMAGGAPTTPYNVAIILDTTLSMNANDSDCGATQMQCALNGVQTLMKSLVPCPSTSTSCTVTNGVAKNAVDTVSLFTFPNVSTGTKSIDTNCTTAIPSGKGYAYSSSYGYYSMLPQTAYSGVPTALPYSFPSTTATTYTPGTANPTTTGTYQLTNYLSDYRTSSSATSLSSTSDVVQAAGGASGCGGMLPPNYDGEYGTYYAAAIYAAQASLAAQAAANPGTQNVIILLSDGDATAPQTENGYPAMPSPADASGNYPSYMGECGQGITAAKYAAAQGTRFYTVAYGSSTTTGCTTDAKIGSNPGIKPCGAMAAMASSPAYFFSDYTQSGSKSACVGNSSTSNLNTIFQSIYSSLSTVRLIPNGTA
jgi:hypothetical protein